jgi:hypothetical protein
MKLMGKSKFNYSLIILTITLFCFLSCENQENSQLVDLSLSFNSSAKTNSSKDITPSDDELTVFKFIVDGVGPRDKTFHSETTDESTQLTDLIKGKWDISVVGYNVNDEAIVEGSGTYYLFNSLSVVDINLDYLVGDGDIDIDFYWNTDQVDSTKVGVITTYYKLDNNTFTEYVITDDKTYETGHADVTTTLAAGNYLLACKLYSGPTEMSGLAQEVRVLANHTTVGSNTFVIGDTTLDYGINFYCNTHLPIRGVITATPEIIIANQDLSLTFTPTTLPSGHTADEIRYCWYFDGSEVVGESTNVLTIAPVEGEHRYDMFAYIDGISGTLGSTKIIVTCN